MAKCIALLVGNGCYQDKILAQLKMPVADIAGLASVLRDPAIGNFNQVEILMTQPAQEVGRQIHHLFRWKKKHDLVLFYFTGHAVLDETGQLYLATVDTRLDSLKETAISTADITTWLDGSFSRQKILLLDCYYSGMFTLDRKLGDRLGISDAFKGNGSGRVILTATDTLQYLLPGDEMVEVVEDSTFTHHLIQGLRTGLADSDGDGQIGLEELYHYICHQTRGLTAGQTFRKWSYSEQDEFIIARNPKQMSLRSPIKWDLIFGAIMAPTLTIMIGGVSSLSTSVGMAGLILLIYALLYYLLE